VQAAIAPLQSHLPARGDLMTTLDLLNLFCLAIISGGIGTIVLTVFL
jgi:hypothetical protein